VGDGAVLINPFDTEEFKDALEKVLEDVAISSELAERGYIRSKEFSWEKTAANTLNVYEDAYKMFKK
jgi:glycosyltransferase involved in cell wall biosynthesis